MAMVKKKEEGMDIETRMIGTALHETYHGLHATQAGLCVTGVEIHPKRQTIVTWPFAPRELWEAYAQHPLLALQQLRAILGTLLAPHLLLRDGTTGCDLVALQAWESAWRFARVFSDPVGPTFAELRAQAEKAVLAWHATERRSIQVRYIAEQLLDRNAVDAETWKALVRQDEDVAAPAWRKRYASV